MVKADGLRRRPGGNSVGGGGYTGRVAGKKGVSPLGLRDPSVHPQCSILVRRKQKRLLLVIPLASSMFSFCRMQHVSAQSLLGLQGGLQGWVVEPALWLLGHW
eukprot:209292-Pelagomonas_calceolata.AAC.7